ncbi:hypothetical protein AMJ44_06520 [candidate division WOR-1 bacterium DG_54_3]|uniref:Uncharacterized protein n=1 Tax=candidate division WOR-1 bacterium DG_54_3 TaxID=1703775 RepID=A0A0S7Y1E3_UNCSA|nr:MAG: hypothetical protein AMJ44_06520 [candidate division WOR-1 bacterium DG_54_3]
MTKTKKTRSKRAKKKEIRPSKQETPAVARQVIGERNRIVLAYMELGRDKTFQKLPEDQKLELIKEVLSIGDEVAGWVKAENGTKDPRKIATRLGIKIFGTDRGKAKGSEYRKGRKEIVIYRDFHEKLLREVKSPELSEHLLKFVVAHELFHHLEINRIGEIYKRYKFETWRIGPFVGKGSIKGLSDVAARAFTQSLLGLEISPQVFDYLTYIVYNLR